MPDQDDLRAELADIAASLRAHLEWQAATGSVGLPKAAPRLAPPLAELPKASAEAADDRPHLETAPGSTAAGSSYVAPRTEAPPPLAPLRPGAMAAQARAAQPTAPVDTEAAAPERSLADRQRRLVTLAAEVAACTACRLSQSRTQTVFARGNPAASLCFIGEAPGADEDAQGLPFVGRAGQLLDKMIGAMGLSPDRDVYVLNIIRCRPPENRRPEADEVAACMPYLQEQLDLVRPKVIVALGNTAVASLLGTTLGITKLRGEWKLYRGTTLVMPTYHPSYLLRPGPQQTEAKKQAWDDLQAVLRELNLPVPGRARDASKRRDDPRKDGMA